MFTPLQITSNHCFKVKKIRIKLEGKKHVWLSKTAKNEKYRPINS